jgi:hypothetical protein
VQPTATTRPEISSAAAASNCPFCGGPSSHAFTARDRNREITRERFEYASCQHCGTLFMADPPADLGRYYEGDYYHFGPDGEPLWRSNEHRKRSASYRVGLVLDHVS